MIYTVTFNPSLDYIVSVNDFTLGKTNRASSEQILPGGKGINVSTVLHNLGFETTALGFTAGFTGEEIKCLTDTLGFAHDFITVANGLSRINVKLKNYDGTEINGIGPDITAAETDALMQKLDTLKKDDTLVLAGSIPSSLPSSIYETILERLEGKGIHFVVDATKDLLLKVLPHHPFLIKPNNHELGEIFNVTLSTAEEVIPYAKKLQEKGAGNVLVSMSSKGAVLVDENGDVHTAPTPKGTLVNAVGAGDSMVAGFLAGWMERHDYQHALQMGLATGSASAFSDFLATKEDVLSLYNQTFS